MKSYMVHAALYTSDIEKSKEYYVTYFDGKSNEIYKNAKGFSSYFITFEQGARLEIMNQDEYNTKEEKGMGYHHIAFSVGTKENVINLTKQIVEDGYLLVSPPRTTGDGYFESCVEDPDGNRVEITEWKKI